MLTFMSCIGDFVWIAGRIVLMHDLVGAPRFAGLGDRIFLIFYVKKGNVSLIGLSEQDALGYLDERESLSFMKAYSYEFPIFQFKFQL